LIIPMFAMPKIDTFIGRSNNKMLIFVTLPVPESFTELLFRISLPAMNFSALHLSNSSMIRS